MPGSLLMAFLWHHAPWSLDVRRAMPDAILLVTLYWVLRKPHLLGCGWAFVLGLIRDSSEGAPLGEHALAMVVVCYLVQLGQPRLRLLALWQQALVVVLLCALYLLACNWVHLLYQPAIAGKPLALLPAVYGGLCWPVLCLLLRLLEKGGSPQRVQRA